MRKLVPSESAAVAFDTTLDSGPPIWTIYGRPLVAAQFLGVLSTGSASSHGEEEMGALRVPGKNPLLETCPELRDSGDPGATR